MQKMVMVKYFHVYLDVRLYEGHAQDLSDYILGSNSLNDNDKKLQNAYDNTLDSSDLALYKTLLVELRAIFKANRVLLYSPMAAFKLAIEQFGRDTYTPVMAIGHKETWLRDYIIETDSKVYIRDKIANYFDSADFESINSKPYLMDGSAPPVPDRLKDKLDTIVWHNKVPVRSSSKCLEGGNFFDVHNFAGSRYLLIGERAIQYEQRLRYEKNQRPLNSNNRTLDTLYRTQESIIKKYANIFNLSENNVLVIPNLCYHIDLQMSYIGNGVFLVNSFEETFKQFKDQINAHEDMSIIKYSEEGVNRICDLLEEHNFIAEKIAGTLYITDNAVDQDNYVNDNDRVPAKVSNKSKNDVDVWLGRGIISSFMNGFDSYSLVLKKHYFVTIDSDHTDHKEYFCDILKKHRIEAYFVKINDPNTSDKFASIADTINYVSDASGSIRCQTSFINSSKIRDGDFWNRRSQRGGALREALLKCGITQGILFDDDFTKRMEPLLKISEKYTRPVIFAYTYYCLLKAGYPNSDFKCIEIEPGIYKKVKDKLTAIGLLDKVIRQSEVVFPDVIQQCKTRLDLLHK